MSNFDPNAILRGAQLTLVGARRALENPELFKSAYYSQALKAVAIGVFIRVIITAPIIFLRLVLHFVSFFVTVPFSGRLLASLGFFGDSVLQVPLFLMSLMRYIVPTLDKMFMLSLAWVDKTYLAKHLPAATASSVSIPVEIQYRLYYPTLSLYKPHKDYIPPSADDPKKALKKRTLKKNSPLKKFLYKSLRKAALSVTVYLLTFLPVVGPLVLPVSSAYSLHQVTGPLPAGLFAFASMFILPKSWTVKLLQTYFASRTLMRELLEPYFSRLPFSSEQKRRWFRDREGLLLGFGVGWMLLMKIPLVGVLIYGIAEASTAYLITKITEPVPPPSGLGLPNEKGGFDRTETQGEGLETGSNEVLKEWCESQTRWKNKQKFLSLPVDWLGKFTGVEGVEGFMERQQQPQPPRSQDEGESMRYRRQFPGGYVSPSDRVNNESTDVEYSEIRERGFTGGRV